MLKVVKPSVSHICIWSSFRVRETNLLMSYVFEAVLCLSILYLSLVHDPFASENFSGAVMFSFSRYLPWRCSCFSLPVINGTQYCVCKTKGLWVHLSSYLLSPSCFTSLSVLPSNVCGCDQVEKPTCHLFTVGVGIPVHSGHLSLSFSL